MFGKFDDQVASKEPTKVNFNYGILLKKLPDTNRERNRVLMNTDIATGNPYAKELKQM